MMLSETISTILKDTYMIADKVNDKPTAELFDADDSESNDKPGKFQPVFVFNVFNINTAGGDL